MTSAFLPARNVKNAANAAISAAGSSTPQTLDVTRLRLLVQLAHSVELTARDKVVHVGFDEWALIADHYDRDTR